MNKTHIATALAALALSGSLMAETLVTVNGTKIDSKEIERRAKATLQQSQGQVQDGPQLRQFLTREMVVETAVAQEAKRLGLDKSDEFKAAIESAKKSAKEQGATKQADYKQNWTAFENQLLGSAFAADVIKKNPVTPAQVQERYNQIKSRYQGSEEVQLGEIVTDKADQAQAVIKELSSKKKFVDVAKKYSIDPAAKSGNVLTENYIPLVDLKEGRPQIYQAIANLKKGQFTKQPLTGEQLSVVFYVNDRRAVKIEPFEKVSQNIGIGLTNERINNAVDDVLKKANIKAAK
ncbi:peptidyl-prolyl cis-trans isomerase [Neisseriaceae bacterium B1]